MESLGQRIRQARKQQKLTQEQLAKKAGISTTSLRLYETGQRIPRSDCIHNIASALKLPPGYFFNSVDAEEETGALSMQVLARVALSLRSDEESPDAWVTEFVSAALASLVSKLNLAGQKEALARVSDLAEIPKYQRKVKE